MNVAVDPQHSIARRVKGNREGLPSQSLGQQCAVMERVPDQ